MKREGCANRAVHRMVDANLNRAAEGLRAVEDVFRFIRPNASLSREARSLRHALAACVFGAFRRKDMLTARDSERDVGSGRTGTGVARRQLADLLAANMRRAQEGLRVIEEAARWCGRPGAAAKLQRIRFRLYSLEKRAWLKCRPRSGA